MFPNIMDLMVVWINGRNFTTFYSSPPPSQTLRRKGYEVDELVCCCGASRVSVVLAYGFCDEYSFAHKKASMFYESRGSKVLSILASFFITSVFVRKWSQLFPPKKELQYPHLWRQNILRVEAQDFLKGAGAEKRNKNDLLFDEFNFNYNTMEAMFRQAQHCLKGAQLQKNGVFSKLYKGHCRTQSHHWIWISLLVNWNIHISILDDMQEV